jgi:glutaredoxin
MKTVTLYTRRSCCLCHEARAALDGLAAAHSFTLRVVDIDTDLPCNDPRRSHLAINIPVVELDGAVVCQHRVDVGVLGRLLSEG